MKHTLLLFFLLSVISSYGQQLSLNKADSTNRMTFTCKFHSGYDHKEGRYYFKDHYSRISDCSVAQIVGFLINVPLETAKKFDGKKVKVTGAYQIIPAVKVEYDKDGNKEVSQGYGEDVFLFNSPIIEEIKD